MKKVFLAMGIMAGVAVANISSAQVSFSVNIGVPVRPVVVAPAPVVVAPAPVESYYYYPDINCYYDAAQSVYIYPQNNVWVSCASVPPMWRGYNFGGARRIVMNQNQFRGRGIVINGRPYESRPMMMNRGQAQKMMMAQGGGMRGGDMRRQEDGNRWNNGNGRGGRGNGAQFAVNNRSNNRGRW